VIPAGWPWWVPALGTATGLAWLGLRWFEWAHLYRPSRAFSGTPADVGLSHEEVTFVSEDGRILHGWWIPSPHAAGALLYCHGNAGNISTRLRALQVFQSLGLHLFIFDYRGYGRSRGLPSEQGLYRDARAAYEVVRARYRNVEQPPVVVYGRSLGGVVALHLASERPLRGVVAEATFTSAGAMAEWRYHGWPVGFLCRSRFNAEAYARASRVPKLIAHSCDDTVVPFAMGRTLFEHASAPKQFVPLRGPHGEPGWASTAGYLEKLTSFVTACLRQ
jgi:fermentation-respiration switch protein FrsA (DUF1100 family)